MSFRKHLVVTAIMVFVAAFAFAHAADAARLKLLNNTASDIHAIYISDSNTNNWEENIIEGYMLPSGNELDIEIPGTYKNFDLRVEDEDGNSENYQAFPGKTKQIILNGAGESEYQ